MTQTNPTSDKILFAAVELAKHEDYKTISKHAVANKAQVSPGMINHYFVSVDGLWRAVMDYAVEHEIPSIVARGCLNRLIFLRDLNQSMREKLNTYFTDGSI